MMLYEVSNCSTQVNLHVEMRAEGESVILTSPRLVHGEGASSRTPRLFKHAIQPFCLASVSRITKIAKGNVGFVELCTTGL